MSFKTCLRPADLPGLITALSFAVQPLCLAQTTAPTYDSRLPQRANPPVCFEQNVGQADPAVKFLAHGSDANLLLTRNEAWQPMAPGQLMTFTGGVVATRQCAALAR